MASNAAVIGSGTAWTSTASRMIPSLAPVSADVELINNRVVLPVAVKPSAAVNQSAFGGEFVDVLWKIDVDSKTLLETTSVTAMLAELTPPATGLSA